MKPTIQALPSLADALAKFTECEQVKDNGSNNHLPVFLHLVDKLAKEYRHFDYFTLIYLNKSHEIPERELAELASRWLSKMVELRKIERIPSLVYDTESYVFIG